MDRRDVLIVLPALAVGAALAPADGGGAQRGHKILHAAGVNLSYHSHEFDWWPVEGSGRIGFDVLVENTDPGIKYQVDIGWAAFGGADVVDLIKTHASRLGLLHLRDFKDGQVTTAGEGSFDWPAMFQATQLLGDPLCYVEGGDAKVACTDLQKFGWGRA
jgi:sugar phosphate isomerase/epimerase